VKEARAKESRRGKDGKPKSHNNRVREERFQINRSPKLTRASRACVRALLFVFVVDSFEKFSAAETQNDSSIYGTDIAPHKIKGELTRRRRYVAHRAWCVWSVMMVRTKQITHHIVIVSNKMLSSRHQPLPLKEVCNLVDPKAVKTH